tara:strand:+ start:1124 stop:1621 length:498 start_codon:yes stop_codon:yes gene_type:complete
MFELSLLDNATLWVATSFIIFVVISYHPVKSQITKSLDHKINELKKKLNDSKNLKAEAEKMYRAHLIKQKQNEEKIIKLNNDAKNQVNLMKKKIEEEIEINIKRKQINYEMISSQMESKIENDLKKEILIQTLKYTEFRIKQHLKKKHNNKLIEESLNKLSGHFS